MENKRTKQDRHVTPSATLVWWLKRIQTAPSHRSRSIIHPRTGIHFWSLSLQPLWTRIHLNPEKIPLFGWPTNFQLLNESNAHLTGPFIQSINGVIWIAFLIRTFSFETQNTNNGSSRDKHIKIMRRPPSQSTPSISWAQTTINPSSTSTNELILILKWRVSTIIWPRTGQELLAELLHLFNATEIILEAKLTHFQFKAY